MELKFDCSLETIIFVQYKNRNCANFAVFSVCSSRNLVRSSVVFSAVVSVKMTRVCQLCYAAVLQNSVRKNFMDSAEQHDRKSSVTQDYLNSGCCSDYMSLF